MRSICLFLLVLPPFLESRAQLYEPDVDYASQSSYYTNLRTKKIREAKVRSETTFTYRIRSGKEPRQLSNTVCVYDTGGRKIGDSCFDPKGRKTWSESFTYDEKGRETEYYAVDKKGVVINKYRYTRNPEGKILESISYRKGGEKTDYKSIYQYDAKGRLEDEIIYKGEKQYSRVTRKHNEKGKMTEEINYRGDKITCKTIQKYNELGKIAESMSYYKEKPSGKSVYDYYPDGGRKATYIYHGKGKLLHTWSYDCKAEGELVGHKLKDTSMVCTRNETDKDGNTITIREERSGSRLTRAVTRTNKDGKLLESIDTNTSGKIMWRTVYTYDERGNISSIRYFGKGDEPYSRQEYKYEGNELKELLLLGNKDQPLTITRFSYEKFN